MDFYIDRWSMDKIVKLRNSLHWIEYIECMEYIINRASHWEIDFGEVENLVSLLVNSIQEISEKEDFQTDENSVRTNRFAPAYTFRLCVGGKVLDIVKCRSFKKLKSYPGEILSKGQIPLSIYFIIGDSTSYKYSLQDSIFYPVKIFDGRTSHMDGREFYNEICRFLISYCGCVRIY